MNIVSLNLGSVKCAEIFFRHYGTTLTSSDKYRKNCHVRAKIKTTVTDKYKYRSKRIKLN